MIDPYAEHLVALHEVPEQLPRRRGRKVHPSSVYRWAQRGVAGVRLEILMVGAIAYTSREALTRFIASTTRLRQPLTSAQPDPLSTDAAAQPAADAALVPQA